MHIQRKEALDFDDMVAIATVGAHECLRSGITTIGDCSFSGAAAIAAAATGLRAIVYLEVFGRDASALERFHESHARIETVLSDRVAPRRLAARAVHLHDRDLPRLCRARPAPGDPFRRERRRARLARRRRGRLEPARRVPRTAARGDRDSPAGGRGPARPEPDGGPLRARRRRGDRAPGPARRRCRALPPLERLPRLRGRAARGAARGGSGRLDRDRQPRLDAVARPVRRAPQRRSSARGPAQGGPDALSAARRARARNARRRPRSRAGRPHRLARARKAGRSGRRSRLWTLRSIPWKILLRQPSSAALPTASQLLWWPANSAT